jgi:methionyl aminopeptidase
MKVNVPIKSPAEIAKSRAAATLAAEVLAMIASHVKGGGDYR